MNSAGRASLLDSGPKLEPEHRNGLNIHLPMALAAL
jgi:hypothetical protein